MTKIEYLREWRRRNPGYMREWRRRNPEKAARSHENYRRRREEVAGRSRPDHCELCGEGAKVMFDHCHYSGIFRGWLCHHCNSALGHAKDNPALLRLMADYLERHEWAK